MRRHRLVSLAAAFLAFIAISVHIANGLTIPLSARSAAQLDQTPVTPASRSSLDRRVLDFGGGSRGDLFDVINQVLTKPHEASFAPVNPEATSSALPPVDTRQPVATIVQPSGRLRQLERPRWMKGQPNYGLTPKRLAALQSKDTEVHVLLIKALNRAIMTARNNVSKAEASGNARKIAAWREKHNADFAIRDAVYSRLGGKDTATAEKEADDLFVQLQATNAKLAEVNPAVAQPLPFLGPGRIHRDKRAAIAAYDLKAKGKSMKPSFANENSRRRRTSESTVKLSSARNAEESTSLDPATKKVPARKRSKKRELIQEQPHEAGTSGASAAQHTSTNTAGQDGARFDGRIHIPFDWEH